MEPVAKQSACLVGRAVGLVRARLTGRADTEHEQAILRLAITALIIPYFLFSLLSHGDIDDGFRFAFATASLFFVFSVLIIADIVARADASPIRRVIGMVGDMAATTYCLCVGGEKLAPLYIVKRDP